MNMRTRVIVCFAVGAIAAVVFHRVRGLYPQHAFLLGLAICALTYSLLRAIDNLRRTPGQGAPWDQEETRDE